MINSSRPVVVGVNGTSDCEPAVAWGAREAASLGVPLQLMYAYSFAAYGSLAGFPVGAEVIPAFNHDMAQDLVDAAVERQTQAYPEGPEVTGVVTEGTAVWAMLQASEAASVVVVGSRMLGPIGATLLGSTGAAVAAQAACPAVVVRGAAGRDTSDGRVVVGVDLGALCEATLGYAFDHASRYGVGLRAILSWYSGPRLLARWTESDMEEFRTHGHLMLAEALAGWQEKYPDVAVERDLVDAHPVDALVAESLTAHTLVIGAHGRHARLDTVLGSVSQGVLHHATCPVVVLHGD